MGSAIATGGSLKMTLRPGEALVWRWGHLTPDQAHRNIRALYPDADLQRTLGVSSGLLEGDLEEGAVVEGVKSTPAGLTDGTITWTMQSPYVIVGGKLLAEGRVRVLPLMDGKTWAAVGDFDKNSVQQRGEARYSYQLRCQLSGSATLKSLSIVQ
jgi:hypothetical protein